MLVFALAQGIFWAGVASTFLMGLGTAITVAAIATIAVGAQGWARRLASSQPGSGTLAMRGLEVAAALRGVADVGYVPAGEAGPRRTAQAVVVGGEPVDEAYLASAPELKIVARFGVGYDAVDVAAWDADNGRGA